MPMGWRLARPSDGWLKRPLVFEHHSPNDGGDSLSNLLHPLPVSHGHLFLTHDAHHVVDARSVSTQAMLLIVQPVSSLSAGRPCAALTFKQRKKSRRLMPLGDSCCWAHAPRVPSIELDPANHVGVLLPHLPLHCKGPLPTNNDHVLLNLGVRASNRHRKKARGQTGGGTADPHTHCDGISGSPSAPFGSRKCIHSFDSSGPPSPSAVLSARDSRPTAVEQKSASSPRCFRSFPSVGPADTSESRTVRTFTCALTTWSYQHQAQMAKTVEMSIVNCVSVPRASTA